MSANESLDCCGISQVLQGWGLAGWGLGLADSLPKRAQTLAGMAFPKHLLRLFLASTVLFHIVFLSLLYKKKRPSKSALQIARRGRGTRTGPLAS